MSEAKWQKGYSGYNPGEGVSSEEPRPWQFMEVASKFLPQYGNVLDVGCGNGKKLQELIIKHGLTVSFTGLDWNKDLLSRTKERFKESRLKISLVEANSKYAYPFPDSTFDAVTFMLSTPDAQEAYRVLKPGGLVLTEVVGDEDKRDIKLMFGYDTAGKPRGYKLADNPGEALEQYTRDFTKAGFRSVLPYSGKWRSFHTEEGLKYLLKATPFVTDYEPQKDREIFEDVVRRFSTPQGIEVTQHRILLIALK